jgi:hypothetical protein
LLPPRQLQVAIVHAIDVAVFAPEDFAFDAPETTTG